MKLKKKQGLEEQEIEDEMVLFDVESFKFYELNETMSLVWKYIETKTPEEIAKQISKEFAVEQAIAKKDVEKAIKALEQLALLYHS